jgi:hypothetical protein
MSAALAQRLAAIPVDGTVPDDFSGAQFSNKVSVKCP